jgi:hypothetical protein
MRAPASYQGSTTVKGSVRAVAARLDPQKWKREYPTVWKNSYFAATAAFFVAPNQPVPKKVPGKGPVAVRPPTPARSKTPPPSGPAPPAGPGQLVALQPAPVGPSPFFEDVVVGGYRYRNVLDVDHQQGNGFEGFQYGQYACLNTRSAVGLDEGGLDLDFGRATVARNPNRPGLVDVTIQKQVRFTEPADLDDELTDLTEVFLQLSLDAWLHNLVFES